MTLEIDENKLREIGVSVNAAIYLYLINKEVNRIDTLNLLLKEGYIRRSPAIDAIAGYQFSITLLGEDFLKEAVKDTTITFTSLEVERLAIELKKIFPKGKKEGTNLYWSEGVPLIAKRLKRFFDKYGYNYTSEQMVDAAKRYVSSFNGNYSVMRTLKYFIFKEVKGADGVESASDLLTYIENKDQEDNNNWTDNVI